MALQEKSLLPYQQWTFLGSSEIEKGRISADLRGRVLMARFLPRCYWMIRITEGVRIATAIIFYEQGKNRLYILPKA